MKKILFLLCIVFLLTSCSSNQPDVQTEVDTELENDVQTEVETKVLDKYAIAQSFVADFVKEDTSTILNDYEYTEGMIAAINEAVMTNVFSEITTNFGTYESFDENYTESENGGYQIITYVIAYTDGKINLNIVFDEANLIAGFNYSPHNDVVAWTSDLYRTEEITFGLEDFKISGTLTVPTDVNNPPLLILVHGSGPNDRNETINDNTPFADIAHFLGENGIATLRYDKRTYTYGNTIDVTTFTFYEETIDDAVYAFEKVKELGYNKILILGHSLGGHAIPIIANRIDADGYIIAAGYVTPLQDLMVTQYTYLMGLDGEIDDDEQASLDTIKAQADAISNIDFDNPNATNYPLGASEVYWKSLNENDVLALAADIKVPVFILNGDRDYQVPVDEFNLWKAALEFHDNFTFKLYPGVNHLLFKGEGTPSNAEYMYRNDVDSEIIDDLIDFITKSSVGM